MDDTESSQPVELPAVDEPPKDGVWRDEEDAAVGGIVLTEAEAEAGRRLGERIDVDDDDDNGLD